MGEDLDLQLLQASIDPDDESEFRILIGKSRIKYITIDPNVFEEVHEMSFGPTLFSLLPSFPPGDWNQARVSRDPSTGAVHFSATVRESMPAVASQWHPVLVDYLELEMGRKLRSNVYEATCPRFDSPLVVKFARFPWEVAQVQAETTAYQWIDGHHIGPAFLGHLTENQDRVIGFIMAQVPDSRYATPEDLALCSKAVSGLHRLGIRHGDLNKHNFLIHHNRATLIDFDGASKTSSSAELDKEMENLRDQLSDMSGRGGRIVES